MNKIPPIKNNFAKKYAQAYVRVFSLTETDDKNIIDAYNYLEQYKHFLSLFSFSIIDVHLIQEILNEIVRKFSFPESLGRLLSILVKLKKAYMLLDVLSYIDFFYKKINEIESFDIHSSHELTSDQLEIIKEFLTHKTNAQIDYSYIVDKNLIAGIRLESNTYFWEYSIAKKLREIKISLLR